RNPPDPPHPPVALGPSFCTTNAIPSPPPPGPLASLMRKVNVVSKPHRTSCLIGTHAIPICICIDSVNRRTFLVRCALFPSSSPPRDKAKSGKSNPEAKTELAADAHRYTQIRPTQCLCVLSACICVYLRPINSQTSSFHGARYFAFKCGLIASCFAVQFASSQ